MSAFRIQYDRGGMCLPRLNLWLDAHTSRKGAERVFVSHAHSDHVARHREVVLTEATAHFMKARLGGKRMEHRLAFGETAHFDGGELPFQITLLPAGHIFGSAMSYLEAGNETLLYTGDFKLRAGLSAEACTPRHADILIMETTFGRPMYEFPPTEQTVQGMVRFCREALDNDETPVLLGYSLGKSQEIVRALAGAGLPVVLHPQVYELTQIYEQLGQSFPPYAELKVESAHGKVVVCPPNAGQLDFLRQLGPVRTAAMTGWAIDAGSEYRYQCDAIFPLSDHADFPDLIEMVRRVAPRKVYTLHGFAADFAQTLRDLGFDAQALSEDEQLGLPLSVSISAPAKSATPVARLLVKRRLKNDSHPASHFKAFAETCGHIANHTDKAEKVKVLAHYLENIAPPSQETVLAWFSPHPALVTYALLRDTLGELAQLPEAEFRQIYLKHNDAGETACEILACLPDPGIGLTLVDAQSLLKALHEAPSRLAKQPLLLEALAQCSPLEAKYLVKLLTTGLRIGLRADLIARVAGHAASIGTVA